MEEADKLYKQREYAGAVVERLAEAIRYRDDEKPPEERVRYLVNMPK